MFNKGIWRGKDGYKGRREAITMMQCEYGEHRNFVLIKTWM